MTTVLCTIFFISGTSALIFETLWFHQAGLALGNSVWASSLILSGFMGGLALGNGLSARYGDRFENPLRVYVLAEGTIAVSGVALVFLFPLLGAAIAPWLRPFMEKLWLLNSLRLLLAFLLLLIPTTAMGVTLPLLTKALIQSDSNFGRVLGRLYGWNTLGAVIGVALGEFYFIRVFGIHGTALTAGGLNLLAAAGAGWLSARTSPSVSGSGIGRTAVGRAAGLRWLIAAFLAGFSLLALEVVWFRFLLLFVFGHSAAFAIMLGVVLSGIALGGLAAALWLRVRPEDFRFAAPIAMAAGLVCTVSYAVFPMVIHPFGTRELHHAVDILRLSLPLMFPTCFLSGVLFTLLGAALRRDFPSETATAGALTFSNTLGAALGSLAGGFVLLPVLGMERSFFLIALLYGAAGIYLALSGPVPRRLAYAAAAAYLAGVVLFPFGSMDRQNFQIPIDRFIEKGTENIAKVREGLTETVIYLRTAMLGRPLSYTMISNSYAIAGTDFRYRRYMKLFVYWPAAVHTKLKHALLICYGVGNTAKAMTDTKSLETIDVVDLSRDILEMNDLVYPDPADNPLKDPRVRVHVEDGRYFLQTTNQRFDLITGEPPLPEIAGVVNLYTREYFRMIFDRLAEGGLVTYWLPVHSLSDVGVKAVLQSFCEVFDDCSLWHGMGRNLMMVGSRGAPRPVTEVEFSRQWNDPITAPEMRALGFEHPEQIGALFIGDAAYLKALIDDAPPLVDDDPRLIEAPTASRDEAARLYRSFNNVAEARERFRRSPFIEGLWPERLRTATLPYFEFQGILNVFWAVPLSQQDRDHNLETVHQLLTRSDLRSPVLWLLGSDWDVQRILDTETPEERTIPEQEFQLGIRLISERQYAAAVEPLRRAEENPDRRETAFRLRVYALCLSGQIARAQRVVDENRGRIVISKGTAIKSGDIRLIEPFWPWMEQTFGINPFKHA